MWEKTLKEFRDELASAAPTPGGGSAAGVAAAFGAALLMMALEVSAKKADASPELSSSRPELARFMEALSLDAEEDVRSYQQYVAARAINKEDPAREKMMLAAAAASAEAAAKTMEDIISALTLGAHIAPYVHSNIASDVAAGLSILHGALGAALATLDANMPNLPEGLKDAFAARRDECILTGARLASAGH